MMTDICPDAERLSAYADGELTRGEAHLVERHLDGCGRCSDQLEAMRRLSLAFRPMAAERMPLELSMRLQQRLGEEACRRDTSIYGWRAWAAVPLSLAASVMLTFGVLLGTALVDEPAQARPVAHLMAPFELIPLGMCPSIICHREG